MRNSKGRRKSTFTAREPVDLIAVVPYVLGFHPQDSVVLLTFGGEENFHARVDLPTEPGLQVEVVELLCGVVAHHRVGLVAVLLYTEDPWAAASFHDAVVPRLVRQGVDVIDVLRVGPQRYHPAEDVGDPGTAYDLSTHRLTAEQVLEGTVVPGTRADLAATLDTVDAADADEVARAVRRHGARLNGLLQLATQDRFDRDLVDEARWVQETVRRHVRAGTHPSAEDAGRLLVLVGAVAIRDVAWSEMSRDDAADHVELWRDLVRRCPSDLLPGPAALLAFGAWLQGHGALAWCALDRCLEVDPDYSLADCISGLLEGAVPPSVWTPIRESELPIFRVRGVRAS
jgi:Domain of unknown function (DUF4192)